ncbi:hypothetical protein [Sulfitobacter sp. PM12]|uniref:hypothetical protein n=1 Tax=Sulfitobacter sp. PM12 TaxID=3138497 RepID=UPI00388DE039
MICTHPHGDTVNGHWLCGKCYAKLSERPKTYKTVRTPIASLRQEDSPPPARYRQDVFPAPISTDENGMTLSAFIEAMAKRLIALTRGGFTKPDAIDYAIDLLRGFEEPFGNPELDWSHAGAWEMVNEDVQYWDHDGAGSNA